MSDRPPKQCETCGGTGWQWLDNSWFRSDGMRKSRCGICFGTGHSTYRHPDPKFVELQRHRRMRPDLFTGGAA